MNKLLVEPQPYKRIFSYAVDALLVIILGIVLFATLGMNVLYTSFGGKEAAYNLASFALDSGLTYKESGNAMSPTVFVYNADGTADKENGCMATPNGEKGYEAYLDRVWYYYTEFLNVEKNPDERVVGREGYSSSDYYKYAYETVFGFTEDGCGTNGFFEYKKEAGVIDYTAKPVLNQNYQQKVDISDNSALTSLLKYFYSSSDGSYSGIYYHALLDMEGTAYTEASVQTYYYQELSKQSMALWLSETICYIPFGLAFLLIIPLCTKKGQTLGKMIFKVSVADERGFYMNWTQRIIRPLLVSLHFALLLIPNVMFGIGLYFLTAAASFMLMSFGKKRHNIHEKLTRTIVADDRKSVLFNNILERTEYLAEHNLDEKGNPNLIISEIEGQPKINLTKEE